jgi:hypothetical protein
MARGYGGEGGGVFIILLQGYSNSSEAFERREFFCKKKNVHGWPILRLGISAFTASMFET